MIPQVVTVGPLAAASATAVATAQAKVAAGALTLDGSAASGGVATLDVARRVLITSVGNDSGITFRITGTNATGNPLRETVTGPNATTAYTTQDFYTVTEVYASGATAANVSVGTNVIASSPWKHTNIHMGPCNESFAVVVTGTVNWTIEYTYDNPNNNQNSIGPNNYPTPPTAFKHPVMQAQTANLDGATDNPIYAWRLVVNSGATGTSSVTATGIQAGTANSPWAA